MESNLKSHLESNLSFANEASIKAAISVQQGDKYGFVLEIESSFGTFYAPLQAYKSKDVALRLTRSQLK